MNADEDWTRIVAFKIRLCRMAERYLLGELRAAARRQGHGLPAVTESCLRAGALAAANRMGPPELLAFASQDSWQASLDAAVRSGAWRRFLEAVVHHAFPAGPS